MVNTSALESRGSWYKSRSGQFLEFHLCSFQLYICFTGLKFVCSIFSIKRVLAPSSDFRELKKLSGVSREP